MAAIDNNNLPKGVTVNPNSGLYVVTNSKGQSREVNPDNLAHLNQYNNSWQTGKPTIVTGIVNPNDGRIQDREFNPANIIGQEEARTEYLGNLTKLKRAGLMPNKDGTYSSYSTNEKLTDAEVQQKIAAAGLPPNTLEIQKNRGKFNPSPPPATVEASTAAVNNVTNAPSGLQPAPADPPNGTLNSPLTVDPQLGATIVKEEPNPAQNAAATNQNIQADPLARTREQRAQDKIDAAALAKNEEQQNIVSKKVRAQSAIIRSDTSTPEQVEAATIERDKLRLQGQALRTEEEVLTKQDPATSLYTGVDQNSGQQRYYNKATGKHYLSEIPPTTEQQAKVRDPASGFINQTTENIVSPPAVATAQVPVRLDPPDPVTQEPSTVQTTATPPITQRQVEDADPEGTANVEEQYAKPQKQTQDADPEGTANIQEQNARPQKQTQDADPEGNTNVEEQYARPQKQPQDADPEGTANRQEQNAAANDEAIRNAGELGNRQGLTTAKLNTQSQATQQDAVNFQAGQDWRVRLSLSPGATYLYKASLPGILAPLQATDGVIFPYTPAISVQYTAGYDPTELTHSNYKFFTYKGSAVDNVTIGCDFTAQDTFEAQYMLAVIHFFKSITKMFYGQDQNPTNGTPPPLCYLTGLGAFQFDTHPLVVTAFTYTLPTDVDYIQAGSNFAPAGVNTAGSQPKQDPFADAQSRRLASNALNPGATVSSPNWQTTNIGTKDATYVPTKISISISAFPIITRNDISNTFSLREYATGALLRGSKRAGGGIW